MNPRLLTALALAAVTARPAVAAHPPADARAAAAARSARSAAASRAAGGGPAGAAPAAAAGAPEAARARTPAELLAAVQRRYDAMKTLRFAFTERYSNRATGKTAEESGTLVIAKPSRMRWEYLVPEPKRFVLDGAIGWFFVPAEQVAYRLRTTEADAHRLPFLFLAGRGDLTRDFDARFEEGAPAGAAYAASTAAGKAPAAGAVRLRLVPRAAGEDYDALVLELDPATAALRALLVTDVLGNATEYVFREEAADVPAPASLFEFEPPAGIEVVDAGSGERGIGADPAAGRDAARDGGDPAREP